MSVIRRHPVITFLLAYALSSAAIPWQSFFAPGVLVAALVVVLLTEGLGGSKPWAPPRLIRWRVSDLAVQPGLVPPRGRPADIRPPDLDQAASTGGRGGSFGRTSQIRSLTSSLHLP
jgi:hypothetical protein